MLSLTVLIFSLLSFEPNALLVKPPIIPSPAEATAPQGPGIALATLLNPPITLPAPLCSPPPIAPPATLPTSWPAAPKAPEKPLAEPFAPNALPKLPKPLPSAIPDINEPKSYLLG